jgi:hypothetical protein
MPKPKRTRLQCYAPPELVQKLSNFQRERGLESQSEALLAVLEEFFGTANPDVTQSGLQEQLAAIEKRLARLESQRSMGILEAHLDTAEAAPGASDPRYKTPTPDSLGSGDWLVTGEAYRLLQARGFRHSLGTFRRKLSEALSDGELSPELKRLGLEADIDLRQASNPKDNSVRWLKVSNSGIN